MQAPTRKPRTKKRGKKKMIRTEKHNIDTIPWRELFKEYDDNEIPGITLRGARVKEGFTQKKLSELAAIPQGHISEIENGKRPIGVKIAKKLGETLNVSYKVFL